MIFDYESECSTDQHRAWLSIFRLYESRSPSPKMTLLYLSEAMVHFVAANVAFAHRIISRHSSIIQLGFIVFLMEFCGADRVRSNGV
jgi:hypothetical protein